LMMYLEDTDGKPIDGRLAAEIREFARTIWADLYDRGMAPQKWSVATKTVRDEYADEMESNWPVVGYCDNHWKAHAIATANYPQWLKTYREKKLEQSDKPARKRRKTVLEDDENGESESESVSVTDRDSPMFEEVDENEDSNPSTPFPVGQLQDDQDELRAGTSRPRARLLPRKDPL
jgi:hypothetical protein